MSANEDRVLEDGVTVTPLPIVEQIRISERVKQLSAMQIERILADGRLVMSRGTRWWVVTGKPPIGVRWEIGEDEP